MRVKLSRIKDIKVSRTDIGSSFAIDNNKIEVDEFTIGTLRRFAREIYQIYTKRLDELQKEYSAIIMSEDDAIERALFGDDD